LCSQTHLESEEGQTKRVSDLAEREKRERERDKWISGGRERETEREIEQKKEETSS
jgi:hypothetical protein